MNIKQAKEALRIGVKAKMSLLLLSSPGIGKSSIVYQLVQEMSEEKDEKIGMIEIRGASSSPSELADIKYVKAEEVHDAPQAWFPTDEKVEAGLCPRTGVIFVDEIGDSMMSVQSTLQRLGLDHKLGSLKMAKSWYVCMASNRQKDKAASGRLSTALINRCMVLTVEPDSDVLYEYFVEQGVSVPVTAYLRFRPDCLGDFDPGARNENPQFLSPRSLEAVDRVIKHMPANIEDGLKLEMISGTVGDGRGSELFGFLKIFEKLPDLNKILLDPEGHPVPEEVDIKVAVAQALIHRSDASNCDSIMKFFNRLPKDIGVASVKDLLSRSKDVALTQTFKTWASANSSLIL